MGTVKDVRKAVNEVLAELGDDTSDAQVVWSDLERKVQHRLADQSQSGPGDAVDAFKAQRRRVRGKNALQGK